MLPDQAWELRPGSSEWHWRGPLFAQPPSRLVPVSLSGPARVLGQGSPFAHQV
jgi:hypothetical protein